MYVTLISDILVNCKTRQKSGIPFLPIYTCTGTQNCWCAKYHCLCILQDKGSDAIEEDKGSDVVEEKKQDKGSDAVQGKKLEHSVPKKDEEVKKIYLCIYPHYVCY